MLLRPHMVWTSGYLCLICSIVESTTRPLLTLTLIGRTIGSMHIRSTAMPSVSKFWKSWPVIPNLSSAVVGTPESSTGSATKLQSYSLKTGTIALYFSFCAVIELTIAFPLCNFRAGARALALELSIHNRLVIPVSLILTKTTLCSFTEKLRQFPLWLCLS